MANVSQATIRNSARDFDLVYAYWFARLLIQNVHQLPSQSTKSPATELLNGTKPLQQHVPIVNSFGLMICYINQNLIIGNRFCNISKLSDSNSQLKMLWLFF